LILGRGWGEGKPLHGKKLWRPETARATSHGRWTCTSVYSAGSVPAYQEITLSMNIRASVTTSFIWSVYKAIDVYRIRYKVFTSFRKKEIIYSGIIEPF